MKPLKIDDLIELLQKVRAEHGNLRVMLVGRYRGDISSVYDTDLKGGYLTVGYDDCQEFLACDDMGDPKEECDMVLGIRKD